MQMGLLSAMPPTPCPPGMAQPPPGPCSHSGVRPGRAPLGPALRSAGAAGTCVQSRGPGGRRGRHPEGEQTVRWADRQTAGAAPRGSRRGGRTADGRAEQTRQTDGVSWLLGGHRNSDTGVSLAHEPALVLPRPHCFDQHGGPSPNPAGCIKSGFAGRSPWKTLNSFHDRVQVLQKKKDLWKAFLKSHAFLLPIK